MSRESEEAAARVRALHRLRTRGLEAGISALIAVAEDEKAPANSRAQAGSALLRGNNLFSANPGDAPKELHEMSLAELKSLSAQIERDRDAILAEMEAEGDESSVFE
ncbi:hypothetical protein [Shinella sumterensis]|uniref:Uncharacterized protein n=1 Tax=Shinella sumterensis TaxID=1967501 RepID=A0AA50CKW1_9HYPH|nr:hypothetical protein [Shinella sumterensis]WLR98745.1 hypothetical protein Q9313_06910 [Shinella sumterensis]